MAPTPELLNYVRQELASGVGKEAVQTALRAAGWAEADIQEAPGLDQALLDV
jgi:hypothetical protein